MARAQSTCSKRGESSQLSLASGFQYLGLMQNRRFRLFGQRNLHHRLAVSRRPLHQVHHRFPLGPGVPT